MNKFTNRSLQGGAAALALALCGSAVAAGDQQKGSTSKQSASTAQSSSAQASGTRAGKQSSQADRAPSVVIGEVVDTRTVNLKGQQGAQHQLVKVKLSNGNTVVVDAGTAKTASTALKNVEQGDRVLAVGRAGRINDRPVLIARSIGELYATGVTSAKTASGKQKKDAG